MSASDKKKLRKEAAAAALTEKQKRELAEAKKLKAATFSFVAIMLALVLVAGAVLGVRAVNNSGIIERNTIAAVIGSHELDSVMVKYYFTDHIQNLYQQWNNQYGSSFATYISSLGLDLNAPLNAQKSAMDPNKTWAEYFLDDALEKAKNDFALYDKAMSEGFKLSEDEQKALDSNDQMLQIYALYGGYQNVDQYLRAIYGYGANAKSYNEYSKITTIASAYSNAHSNSLTYNDAAIDAYGGEGSEKFNNFSFFSFAIYSVDVSSYLTGGTKDDAGKITYSDDEIAAAQKKAEQIANALKETGGLEALDAAISALEINADKETSVTSTKNESIRYTDLPEAYQEWMGSAERKNGDITVIPDERESTDADGNKVKTIDGYIVLCFMERNDNNKPLANVRHLLVKFDGEPDSKGEYSEDVKKKAKEEAEKYLQEWKDGAATEDSFIELVKKYSDDGTKDSGGLIEDMHPDSPYVESFLAWSLNDDRNPGDTEVIVSEYGYHVMYYSSDDTLTYRDYMITEELRANDMEKWNNDIIKDITITIGDTKRLNLDLKISSIAS